MKNLILISLFCSVSLFANGSQAEVSIETHKKDLSEDAKLCQMFQEKIRTHQLNMRDDQFARLTLKAYKNRANIFCAKE